MSDNFFKKVENKTKVDKSTIVNLASKLQKNNLKDEDTLRDVIKELSDMAGKSVSKEQEDKIVKAIINDEVPKDLDKFVDQNYNN
ncbi:MAG: stage VI sporulation protein F [Bacilli bacterium]|nr:stage VI sporulation protein F [Bacilli bacterium]MDD4053433.1 stage VI sporulation protein F [Bacilli bacterium]MDD4410920.1 stage VI sporulation protein F [Bacilli bacterium]